MKTTVCPFDVSRMYISDNANVITHEERQSLLGAIRARDYLSVIRKCADMEWDNHTLPRVRFFQQLAAFFKKNASIGDASVTREAALRSFERGERLCRITNKRLDHFYIQRDRIDPDLNLMINRAERYIRNVLGDYDSFHEEIPFHVKVTAGATATSSRRNSIPFFRFRRTIDVTPRCVPYLKAAYQYFGYPVPRIRSTLCNRLDVVPKNCRTDRMIACEPAGNLPFQLAFDSYVKQRLRKHAGIDLRDQSRNNELARLGSIHGGFATVDLSLASDTVAMNTVAWLLPEPWFQFLCDVRSPFYSFEKNGADMQKYAKFSSMGNGATFALETLLFASFAYATGSKTVSVYGDDIIVDTDCTDKLFRLLRFFGFIPNVEKSFSAGPFRESCGGNFYEGVDITPFYIRTTEPWDLPSLCHNVNGLSAISECGDLWNYLIEICLVRNLPLVPVNENSTSGVFVTPHHAYQRKLFRRPNPKKKFFGMAAGEMQFLAYQPSSSQCECYDTRALALWFLRKQNAGSKDNCTIASRHTTSSLRFRRKWVTWQMPLMGYQSHLFGFSDALLRASQR